MTSVPDKAPKPSRSGTNKGAPHNKPSNPKARKKKRIQKKPSFFERAKLFLSTPAMVKMRRFVGGLLLFSASLYVLIAMFSYLWTSSNDQSILRNHAGFFAPLGENDSISNLCGLKGAYIADWLINSFLGLGSFFLFAFPLVKALQLIGINKTFKRSLFSIFFLSTLSCLWLSLTTSYIYYFLGDILTFLPGGLRGKVLCDSLLLHIGHGGVIALILFSLMIIVVCINQKAANALQNALSFSWLFSIKWRKKGATDEEYEEEEEEIATDDIEENEEETEEEKKETIISPLIETAISTSIVERPQKEKDIEKEPQVSQTGLIIEVAPEEESALDNQGVAISDFVAKSSPLTHFTFPSLDLLEVYETGSNLPDYEEISSTEIKIIQTLKDFGIKARPSKATIGPTVTLYEIEPDAGITIRRIKNLGEDLALALKAEGGIRIIAPIPGKGTIGVEVPNKRPQIVSFHSLLSSRKFVENKMELPIAIGKTITNEVFMFDLAKMPHLLIAGATGQGKSVGLNVMISSLLYSKHPSELKFVMIDPKMLEFSVYETLDCHYLAKLPDEDKCIITDMSKVVSTLTSLCIEMDNRYRLLTEARVRNIMEYNKRVENGELADKGINQVLPYIVLIVDEFADLIMTSGKEVERPITRLAQKARAAGIHMILATQRPTTDIITGTIKANFPARIAFKVFSAIDSRTILDGQGANLLVGRGDMLFYQGKDMLRIQCALIDTPETQRVVDCIAEQPSFEAPYTLPEVPNEEPEEGRSVSLDRRDPLFEEVARMVVETQQGSTSKIQRQFEIGFNRAGRIMDQLEAAGIVAAQHGSKSREVLIHDTFSLNNLLESLRQ